MTDYTDELEKTVASLLLEKKQTLAVAESCTGGLISHRLTNIPGSSEFLIAGVIAYAYQAKVTALGVSWDTLNQHGAVSEETARAMARGARERFGATLGLAVTGIAGPGGGTVDKPVGLTYISVIDERGQAVERHVWHGSRIENKEQSARAALALVLRYVREHE